MQTAMNLAVFFITNRRCLYDEYLEKEKNITRANIQELCGYNDNQARRTIEKFKKKNIIQNDRTGRYANYKLVRKQ